MEQEHYPKRRILLSVTGGTPQIITETLCALSFSDKPFVPTEIHVITTQKGCDDIETKLFRENKLAEFCKDYASFLGGQTYLHSEPESKADNFFIHIIKDSEGRPLSDIRSSQDNERTGDEIMRLVRALCEDQHAAMHVSLAGGRKTMGFYVGYALSLFGHGKCRLSHVLVSEEFEHKRSFYPTPEEYTSKPKILELAEIPVVFMGKNLPGYFDNFEHYSDLVDRVQQSFNPAYRLSFDFINTSLILNGVTIKLSLSELNAYLTIWRRFLCNDKEPIGVDLNFVHDYMLILCYLSSIKSEGKLLDFDDSGLQLEEANYKNRTGKILKVVGITKLKNFQTVLDRFKESATSSNISTHSGEQDPVYDEKFLLDSLLLNTQTKIAKIRKKMKEVLCATEYEIFNPITPCRQKKVQKNQAYSITLKYEQIQIDFETCCKILPRS